MAQADQLHMAAFQRDKILSVQTPRQIILWVDGCFYTDFHWQDQHQHGFDPRTAIDSGH